MKETSVRQISGLIFGCIEFIERLIDCSTFTGDSTIYIAKNVRKAVMSVSGHYIRRF